MIQENLCSEILNLSLSTSADPVTPCPTTHATIGRSPAGRRSGGSRGGSWSRTSLRHPTHSPGSRAGRASRPAGFATTANLLSTSHGQSIVVLASVVRVEELLEPRKKLKVVLKLSFHKPVHRNYLVNGHFLERRLKNFEVVDVLVLLFCIELHLLDLNASWKEHVHELAVGSPSAQLLNFGKLGLNTVVDPGQHVVSGEVLRGPASGVNVNRHLKSLKKCYQA